MFLGTDFAQFLVVLSRNTENLMHSSNDRDAVGVGFIKGLIANPCPVSIVRYVPS
jgi:hypothetical protein